MYYEVYLEQDPDEQWREIEINSQKFRVLSLGRVQLNNDLITQGSLCAGYYRIGRVHKYRVHRLVKQIFDEAQRTTGIKSQGIHSVCRQLQSHAGGYRWQYVMINVVAQTDFQSAKPCDMWHSR